MSRLGIWATLGVASDSDERTIKRAYAAKLKQTNPEDDPDGFMRLREAYDSALSFARYRAQYEDDDWDDNWDNRADDDARGPDPAIGDPRSAAELDLDLERAATTPPTAQTPDIGGSDLGGGQFRFRPLVESKSVNTSDDAERSNTDAHAADTEQADIDALWGLLFQLEAALRAKRKDVIWGSQDTVLQMILHDPLMARLDISDMMERALGALAERTWPRSRSMAQTCALSFGWENPELGRYRPHLPELYQDELSAQEVFSRVSASQHEFSGALRFLNKPPNPKQARWILDAMIHGATIERLLRLETPDMALVRSSIPAAHREAWLEHGPKWQRLRQILSWVVGISILVLAALWGEGVGGSGSVEFDRARRAAEAEGSTMAAKREACVIGARSASQDAPATSRLAEDAVLACSIITLDDSSYYGLQFWRLVAKFKAGRYQSAASELEQMEKRFPSSALLTLIRGLLADVQRPTYPDGDLLIRDALSADQSVWEFARQAGLVNQDAPLILGVPRLLPATPAPKAVMFDFPPSFTLKPDPSAVLNSVAEQIGLPGGVYGRVVLRCLISPSSKTQAAVHDCVVLEQSGHDPNLVELALALAARGITTPAKLRGAAVGNVPLVIPFQIDEPPPQP